MNKRTIAFIAVVCISGEVQAFPIEAISTFFSKLFKGGTIGKEAVTAGRAAEGATVAKGVEHLPVSDTVNHTGSTIQTAAEPKPNMLTDPFARNRKDSEAYKSLRVAATKGDSDAMVRMSEMTISGKVSDPGEPYFAYWLIQAARAGNQAAARNLRDDCSGHEDKRRADRWFDAACGATDGRNLYAGSPATGSYSPIQTSPSIPKR